MKVLIMQFSPLSYFPQSKFLGALFSYLLLEQKSGNFMPLLHKEHMYCKLKIKFISVDVLTSFCRTLYLPKYEMTPPVHSHRS